MELDAQAGSRPNRATAEFSHRNRHWVTWALGVAMVIQVATGIHPTQPSQMTDPLERPMERTRSTWSHHPSHMIELDGRLTLADPQQEVGHQALDASTWSTDIEIELQDLIEQLIEVDDMATWWSKGRSRLDCSVGQGASGWIEQALLLKGGQRQLDDLVFEAFRISPGQGSDHAYRWSRYSAGEGKALEQAKLWSRGRERRRHGTRALAGATVLRTT